MLVWSLGGRFGGWENQAEDLLLTSVQGQGRHALRWKGPVMPSLQNGLNSETVLPSGMLVGL